MPRIVDHDARRELILERCFELFARLGYGAVTMRGIAREVGMSTGTLYHYFPDKETLTRSLFHHVSRRDVAEATAALSVGETQAEKLAALFGFLRANEDRLRSSMLVALDHQRQHPEDRVGLGEAVALYRTTLVEQLGLDEPGLESVVFSLVLGAIAHRTLDPSVEEAPHLAALLKVLTPIAP